MEKKNDQAIKERAKQILQKMSLKEKIGQMNQEPLRSDNIEEMLEKARKGELGSVILSLSSTAGNDAQEKTKIEVLNRLERAAVEESPSGIPIIVGRDVIHGHHTVFPIPLALSASFHPSIVEKGYRFVAREAANDGIHWTFSPMIDISRDPRWGRCIEGIGEDPYLGERIAEAAVKGFQGSDPEARDSIAACAKHYIGYGASEGGRDYAKTEISDYSLRNYYLKPFRAAVNAGLATVMSSFNEISGVVANASHYLLTELLKEELGFEGYVISDWAAVESMIKRGRAEDREHAAELAANAGLDMDMVSRCFVENLEALVENGKVSEAAIDEAVLRILYVKLKFGLFEHPYLLEQLSINEEEHRLAAKVCSDETMVLLKNKNQILPFSKTTKVAVVGPMLFEKKAHFGSWTLDGDLQKVKSVAEVWKEKDVPVWMPTSEYLWDDMLKQIRRSDSDVVVVMLGESPKSTGEANSMARVELPAEQLELVKKLHGLGKPVVAVMAFGRPIALEEADPYLDAVLYAWHSGTCAPESIVDILYGEVNPSGRVPMTFPRCTGQIPIYYNYPLGHAYESSYYAEKDMEVYNDCLSTPMYPFGYGLSYTEFRYTDLHCEESSLSFEEIQNGKKFRIHVTVENIGERDGWETAQCYIRDCVATMIRPQRELKGFEKRWIPAGEKAEFCFELGFEELAYYNQNREFTPERGKFEVYVGKDCYASDSLKIKID